MILIACLLHAPSGIFPLGGYSGLTNVLTNLMLLSGVFIVGNSGDTENW